MPLVLLGFDPLSGISTLALLAGGVGIFLGGHLCTA
jgi:hypothetical protein